MKEGLALGLDFGTTTIGVAIGNPVTRTASKLATVKYGRGDAAEKLSGLIEKWKPTALVVGYPLDGDGKEQPMSRKAAKFADSLRERYRIETVLVDERYSSAAARAEAAPKEVDAKAAEIILQAWFDG